MAWEARPDSRRPYFYRAERVGGRVRKRYVGRGPAADAAADEVAQARVRRESDRAAVRRLIAGDEPIERLYGLLDDLVRLLADATLMAGGLHKRRGEWRRMAWTPRSNESANS